jgi:hypothetical protein
MMVSEMKWTVAASYTQLTENEVNNLIYSLIKFGFRKIKKELDSPPNSVIKQIMFDVMNNPTTDNIIESTLIFIVDTYRIPFTEMQVNGIREHMKLIAKMFMSESPELRNDLGEDSNSDEFITKH